MDREFSCTVFARLDVSDPHQVADFIEWLYLGGPWPPRRGRASVELAGARRPDPIETVEHLWGWHAPRRRLVKLLWQLLYGDDDEEHFNLHFWFVKPSLFHRNFVERNALELEVVAARCREVLLPIQERLRWVLDGFRLRCEEDREIGQGAWGEEWWLPTEEAEYVRRQIGRARLELIERPADYEDAMRWTLENWIRHGARAIEVPCQDPDRAYEGRAELWPEAGGVVDHVFVVAPDGRRWLLTNVRYPLDDPRGQLTWGYGGGGPAALAESLLADALDGDLGLAQRFAGEFLEEIVLRWPMHEPFRIARSEVLRWLRDRGLSEAELERSRRAREERLARYRPAIHELQARLRRARELAPLGLKAQRFDLVPPDFECALYLDLKAMLESGFVLLRCARCGLPISCGGSERTRRQLGLSRRGVPVYHPECHAEHRREVKRRYYRQRAQDPAFREARRLRAREARRLR